jgi:hypothetical protein
LVDLIRDRTFLARRHAHLLLSSRLVEDEDLRALQLDYRSETKERERRALALDFEKLVRDPVHRVMSAAARDSSIAGAPRGGR